MQRTYVIEVTFDPEEYLGSSDTQQGGYVLIQAMLRRQADWPDTFGNTMIRSTQPGALQYSLAALDELAAKNPIDADDALDELSQHRINKALAARENADLVARLNVLRATPTPVADQ